jgi:hypothetical protein
MPSGAAGFGRHVVKPCLRQNVRNRDSSPASNKGRTRKCHG